MVEKVKWWLYSMRDVLEDLLRSIACLVFLLLVALFTPFVVFIPSCIGSLNDEKE